MLCLSSTAAGVANWLVNYQLHQKASAYVTGERRAVVALLNGSGVGVGAVRFGFKVVFVFSSRMAQNSYQDTQGEKSPTFGPPGFLRYLLGYKNP